MDSRGKSKRSKVFEPNSISKDIDIASNLGSFPKRELGKDQFSQPLPIFLHHKALLLILILGYLILPCRTDHESLWQCIGIYSGNFPLQQLCKERCAAFT